MAEVVNMPKLSDTMEEGVVAKWLKQKGDKVEEGDILAEIETDKATMEFESFYDGVLLYVGVEEGEGAPVNSLLAIIGEEGEDIDDLIENGKKEESSKNKSESEDESDDEKSSEDSDEEEKSSEEKDSAEDETSGMPEGVEVVTMPRLSDTMEEGTVASWLKSVGDDVEEGDILAEIETDKATMEFESFFSGKLLHIGIDEGESAPVDDVLAIIGPDGTDVDEVLKNLKSGDSDKKSSDKKTKSKDTDDKDTSSDSKDKKTEATKGDKSSNSTDEDGRILASPLAKKIAEEKGIDLRKVEGTGDNGRIIRKDVEDFKPSDQKEQKAEKSEKVEQPKEEAKSATTEIYSPVGEEEFEENKNSQMRKTIAKRLLESKNNAPHYYLNVEVDMENAMSSRTHINDMPDVKVSFNDLVIKASAMALRKHPQVNSSWNGETTKIAKHIHVGVAVAVEEGLLVPVLEFADQQSLTQIGNNVKSLATKAKNKKLQPNEMEGSTFTVSNLGMFGITEFTSIINQPNSAILSVGTIVEKPVVKNGEIVVGHTMTLTLACDHRTVDGATGAKFLQTLKTYLENPVTMLA
ncbi:pyruvate dehydrogenase complex dihydrolipoamide acetyltransferase [Psychroflexus aestuariivivens]|uniref:pyruvate dehydrogenase complex dihydrolipoamide acetyltransferase n=1 Tax=Psychroflexus aestuariivivens TaxID=1795040 RepID=UPI000FDB9052|nr:pyruvate dehydrogenase complex dihydrolipoamide acetyltransferase [Psychroflexus aestuariivivens]